MIGIGAEAADLELNPLNQKKRQAKNGLPYGHEESI
jgi:hypothetical protein